MNDCEFKKAKIKLQKLIRLVIILISTLIHTQETNTYTITICIDLLPCNYFVFVYCQNKSINKRKLSINKIYKTKL